MPSQRERSETRLIRCAACGAVNRVAREKVERVKRTLESHPELSLRGGHVIVKNLREDLQVTETVLSAAIREVLAKDTDLSVLDVGGKQILKRRRL